MPALNVPPTFRWPFLSVVTGWPDRRSDLALDKWIRNTSGLVRRVFACRCRLECNGGSLATSLAPGKLGAAFSITDASGDNVDVEVYKVLDPVTSDNEFETAPAGQRLVAVQIGVVNQASAPFSDDMNSDTSVVGSDSQT